MTPFILRLHYLCQILLYESIVLCPSHYQHFILPQCIPHSSHLGCISYHANIDYHTHFFSWPRYLPWYNQIRDVSFYRGIDTIRYREIFDIDMNQRIDRPYCVISWHHKITFNYSKVLRKGYVTTSTADFSDIFQVVARKTEMYESTHGTGSRDSYVNANTMFKTGLT
jgi:hypothetical protein